MRLHTRIALTMLTAGAVGAGLLAPGASAVPAPTAPAAPAAPTVTAPTAAQIAAAKAAAAKAAAVKAAAAKRAAVAKRAAALRAVAARKAAMRTKAVKVARAKVRQNPQYVAGGRGPRTFDCAGFTYWVWKQAGRHIAQNTWGLRSSLKRVKRSNARPGDIALYMNGAHHAELYLGHNKTIGCSNSRTDCGVKSISGWYADHFTGFYRVV